MSTKLVVKARQGTAAAHAAGIFATFEVDVVDANGEIVVKLFNGTMRNNGKGYWVTGPARKGNDAKWYKEWMLYPNLDQAGRNKLESWIISEIAKQIPDPSQPRVLEPAQVSQGFNPPAAQAAVQEPVTKQVTAPSKPVSTAPFGGGPINPPRPAQGPGGVLSGPPNNPFAPKAFAPQSAQPTQGLVSQEDRNNFPFGGSGFPS